MHLMVYLMQQEANIPEIELRVDGGPSRNKWLMQFQSDMLKSPVLVPEAEELSCVGVAYAAGMALGLYDDSIFENNRYFRYEPRMDETTRKEKHAGWKEAVRRIL